MGKSLDWVREEPTGRLIFRRAYPEAIRDFLPKTGQRELKVPLRAKRYMTPEAFRLYDQAIKRFEADVRHAIAAQAVEGRKATGTVDALTPDLIAYLVTSFKADDLELEQEARWTARPLERKLEARQRLEETCRADLTEALQLRALGDMETILSQWGGPAFDHAELHGFLIDRTSPEFVSYVRAFHDAQIETWQAILRRLQGEDVPTPVVPPRPAEPVSVPPPPAAPARTGQTFEAIVEALMESPTKPMSATTKESVRTALRLFRESVGAPRPDEINRAMVADWLDALAQRPAKLPQEHRAVPLPALIELYRDRPDVPRLSAKTLVQHLSALGARWTQAGQRGRLDRDAPNPFKDHDLERAKKPRKPKGFSTDELAAIFALPLFREGSRPLGGKGHASYWVPLLSLFTGARPEEAAQLLVQDIYRDAKTGRWVVRITDEGEHPHKGQQGLKTDESPRTFPIPQPLIDLGLLRYRERLLDTKETALFPKLRTKGERGYLFSGLGLWWSKYLKDNGVHLAGTGRQPMREFRHTWATAARTSGIARENMAYIQGHKLSDETAGEGYGDLSPLGLAIDQLRFDGLDLSGVKPWTEA
jgi:integrase